MQLKQRSTLVLDSCKTGSSHSLESSLWESELSSSLLLGVRSDSAPDASEECVLSV